MSDEERGQSAICASNIVCGKVSVCGLKILTHRIHRYTLYSIPTYPDKAYSVFHILIERR